MSTGIGETLRVARRQYGRSLADAAAETRVRETYLAALEEEEFNALGGGVYVKGFLRSYAKFLGLDPEPLLEAYRSHYERDDEAATLPQRPVAPMGPRDRPSGPAVIIVAAGTLLLVFAGIGMLVGGDDEEGRVQERGPEPVVTDSPDPIDPTDGASEPTRSPVAPTPTPTPTASPDPQIEGIEVALSVTGSVSWMRVEVDGETVIEGEQQGGFSRTFTGEEVVSLRIGDASAVSVQANGRDQGSLGSANEVVVVTCNAGETECDVDVVA